MELFRSLSLLHVIILYTFVCQVVVAEFIRVCYFASWSKWKTSPLAKFDVDNIDPAICTHLIYAFGKIDSTNTNLAPLHDADIAHYKIFNNLKTKNSKLKTLLSIGGQNDAGEGFLKISSNDTLLNIFSNNAVTFLRAHAFDGVDLDWEYPNKTTNINFINILKNLRLAFNNEPTSSRLLLTIAAPGGEDHIKDGFNVSEIDKYVDFVNIMTYDYSEGDSQVTVFNSPLFSRNDVRFNPTLNTNWTVQFYKGLGLRYSKMVIGFTGLGRWLVLKNISLTEVGSPTTGVKRKGPDFEFDAALAYPEVCKLLRNSSSKSAFDDVQKMPYLVNGDNWVGYEDVQSIGIKTQWTVQIGAAGMMFWSLDQDDFSGTACSKGKYPLMSTIISITADSDTTTTSTKAPATSTSSIGTSPAAPSSTQRSAVGVTPKRPMVAIGCGSRLMAMGVPVVMIIYIFSLALI